MIMRCRTHSLRITVWLLLALLWPAATGCRTTAAAPTPTATVVPFPTFTSTPIIEPTATPIAASLLPTISATVDDLPLWIAYNAEGSLWLWQAGASRKLTTVDADSPLAISPDRRWIAFRREGSLWVITADGELELLLMSANAIADLPTAQPDYPRRLHHFAWLPHSHRLLWTTSLHTPAVVDPESVVGPNYFLGLNHDLYSVDVDTDHIAQLALPGNGGIFYPSPDGAWIAVVTPRLISLLRADGSGRQHLLEVAEILTYSESPFYAKPLWAADSQSLVVEIPPKDALALAPEPTTIWHLWTDGRAPTQLARIVTGDMTVSISPDLTRIGYDSLLARTDAQAPLTFHHANIDGTANRIFHKDIGGGFREWLPDSAHFVYDAQNGGATYLGHIDGRPAISLGSQAMQSQVWLDAKRFLFIPYSSTPDVIAGLWLGVIAESGVVETRLLAEGATTFDVVHLPPMVTVPPTRLPSDLVALPAPLYVLADSGQIMRLETDGVTIRRLTSEAAPITTFDVDPTGVYLVYVSNNDLFRMTVWGEDRQLLLSGGPLGAPGTSAYYTNSIQRIAFAPDGKRLALARNGIQLIQDISAPDPAATLETVLANGPEPTLPPGSLLYFLPTNTYPSPWSPDGTKLFLGGGRMASGHRFDLIVDVQTGQITEFKLSNSTQNDDRSRQTGLGCSPATIGSSYRWARTSVLLFSASGFVYAILGPPGLSVINAVDGAVAPLFYAYPGCHADATADDPDQMRLFHSVYQTSGGALWGFVSITSDPDLPHLAPMMMAQFDPDTQQITPLRNDSYYLRAEILWAEDDHGAVVIAGERDGYTLKYAPGRLLWLPSDGAPAVDLGIDAQLLRWGPAKDPTTEGEDQ